MTSCVLKTINGKYLQVMHFEDGPRLCAVDQQGEQTVGHTVNVTYHNRNVITFTFSKTDNSVTTKYILQATESSLKLVPLDQVDGFPEASWFEKDGQEVFYNVRTKGKPQKYICIDEDTRGILILSDNVDIRALVKDEAK